MTGREPPTFSDRGASGLQGRPGPGSGARSARAQRRRARQQAAAGAVLDRASTAVVQPPRKRRLLAARLAIGLVATLVLTIGALAAAIAIYSPQKLIKEQLIAQVAQATGRTLTIAGDPSLIFWPSLGVSFADVRLSAPPGMSAPDTFAARSVATRLALLPILSGEAVIEDITLLAPVVDLRQDRNGRASWASLLPVLSDRPVQVAQAATDTMSDSDDIPERAGAAARASISGTARKFALASMTIVDGTLTYTNEATGLTERLEDIDIVLRGGRLDEPVNLKGQVTLRDERIDLDGTLEKPSAVIASEPVPVRLALEGRAIRLAADGPLHIGGVTQFSGPVSLAILEPARLAAMLGTHLPVAGEHGALSVSGQLNAQPSFLRLSGLSAEAFGATARGDMTVALSGPRPIIEAELAIAGLDVDRVRAALAAGETGTSTGPDGRGDLASPGDPAAAGPRDINDLLHQGSGGGNADRAATPRVRGYTARDGWSETPFDLAGLTAIDVRSDLALTALRVAGLSIDRGRLDFSIESGRLEARLTEAQLYGGVGVGALTATPIPAGVEAAVTATIEGVDARAMLRDAAQFETLSGRARIELAMTSQGAHERALVSGLQGRATMRFTDGAINGWNVAEAMRGLQQGRLDGLKKDPTQKTDFASLAAAFDISRGIATNQDLELIGPLVRATGAGSIDLPERKIDYRARPRLVASLSGQGSAQDLRGIEIPLRVRGPLASPSVTPDIGGALGSAEQIGNVVTQFGGDGDKAREAVDGLKRQFDERPAGEVVDDLLRDDGREAKRLLRGIFSRRRE
ncbi:MAG: AsmA family protein [Hyphomicrobiaceae bacterium]